MPAELPVKGNSNSDFDQLVSWVIMEELSCKLLEHMA
jgi:hypothetical protein